MRVTAIVLAAGSSTRFGRPKQLAAFRGETLLGRAVEAAKNSGADRVVVVSPPGVEWDLAGVELIENPDAASGIASSIRAGVAAAGEGRILITLCDQPLVTVAHLRALIAAGAPIVATSYAGTAGVPAVFSPRFIPELLALEGDRGAKRVIESHPAEVVAIPFEEAAVDVDREDDLPHDPS